MSFIPLPFMQSKMVTITSLNWCCNLNLFSGLIGLLLFQHSKSPKHKDNQFIITTDQGNQEILTFESVEPLIF